MLLALCILTGLMFTGAAVMGLMGKAPPPANEAAGALMDMIEQERGRHIG